MKKQGVSLLFSSIDRKIITKSLLVWLAIIPLAIINGAFREIVVEPMLGWYARPISGVILCFLILAICLLLIPRLGNGSKNTYFAIGILWILLTVIFEFIFGLVVLQDSLGELLAAYDITTGNIWIIVVIAAGVSPWLSAKIKRMI